MHLDYFCLLDDDVEIIDNFELYTKNIYEKTKIPIISNFNNELKFKNILFNNINLIGTKNYFGNILIIHKDELTKKGYFNKFEYKWGSEHIEITKRYYRYYVKKSQKALTDLLLLKYYLGENIGIDKSDNEKKLTKLFTGINLNVQLDKNIDHMLYFRYKDFNRKKIMDYYKNKM